MRNNHYVPQFILKNFNEKIDLYNIKTGELKFNRKPEKIFSELGLYSDEIEDSFNRKIESQFANILKDLKNETDSTITISRHNLNLIKKFLLVETLRTKESEEFIKFEREYYPNLKKIIYEASKNSKEEILAYEKIVAPPFKENEVVNLNNKEYWMQTLQVILDSDGTPEDIAKQKYPTNAAYRWAKVISTGFLGFWEADSKEPFIITDIGMTSENEKGWDGVVNHNRKKLEYVAIFAKYLDKIPPKYEFFKYEVSKQINFLRYFTENFMMFSISSKKMLVLISPFFKFRNYMQSMNITVPKLKDISCLENEDLFLPNRNKYVNSPDESGFCKPDKNDEYIYDVHKLNIEETRYINCLMLDRIEEFVGFSDFTKNEGSIINYTLKQKYGIPRINYENLLNIIKERHNK